MCKPDKKPDTCDAVEVEAKPMTKERRLLRLFDEFTVPHTRRTSK